MGACSSIAQIPVSVPTSAPASIGPYDGEWTASGVAADGRSLTADFTVKNSAITSFTYTYAGLNGLSCTGIDHLLIPESERPKITNGAFSSTLGDDLVARGSFSSGSAASGHILAEWKGRINCSTTIEADWTAAKSAPPAQAAAAAPVVVSWCGQNVNCR